MDKTPYWFIYGHKEYPCMTCCRLEARGPDYTIIWGCTDPDSNSHFRFCSASLEEWMNEMKLAHDYTIFEIYEDKIAATERFKNLRKGKGYFD